MPGCEKWSIPLGWPSLLLAAAAVVSGLVIATRPAVESADQIIWTFTQSHADALTTPDAAGVTPLQAYERETGRSVAVRVIEPRALDLRLIALLDADRAQDLPDVVQLEVNSAVKFLDRPVGEVGLLMLDKLMDEHGLRRRFVRDRLAMWQREGITYGLPMDVHPVMLAYRVDLWHRAGIDPTTASTWPEFAEAAGQFVRYWHENGHPQRRALELSTTRSEHLTLLLRQRGIEPIDPAGRPMLDDPRVAETIRFATGLVAGPNAVARPTSRGHVRWTGDFEAGDVAALWMPDWRMKPLEESAPSLAGKVGLMPLPVFESTDRPTATWGGTMLAIPAGVEDVDAAWELALFLATADEVLAGRRRVTGIVPPLPEAWEEWEGALPAGSYFATDPGPLLVDLTAVIPRHHPSSLGLAAAGHLSLILSATVDDVQSGMEETKLDHRLRQRLADAQKDLLRRREHGQRP